MNRKDIQKLSKGQKHEKQITLPPPFIYLLSVI